MSTQDVGGTPCEIHYCLTCGVVCAVPAALIANHRKKGGHFSCPNGHIQGWSLAESEDERTRRERDRLKQENARLEETANERRIAAEVAERTLARHKKRVTAGVCPCCNRTVRQMALHMKNKHPSYNVVPLKATA